MTADTTAVNERIITPSRAIRWVACAVTLVLPFAMFFWIAPYVGDKTIGHDYAMYPTPHQMELQYSLAHGQWPMHAPGFAGGRPSAALTLGQMYHPISHLSALIPGYWEGDALEINTLLRLVSLGLAHLALLIALMRLGLRLDLSFVLSFVTVYNMRMLDMFRFGASLENYTGHIFLCAVLLVHFVRPTRVVGPLFIIASTYLMVVGGHPQMMYYGILGSSVFLLAVPFILPHVVGERVNWNRAGRYCLLSLLCMGVGFLLASAYLVPLYFDFVVETSTRVGQGYQWSLFNCDTWGGAINSFFQPLNISVTSGFGGSTIIVAILVFPALALARVKVPRGVVLLVAFLVLLFAVSLGSATPLHQLFWKYFPLASSFRVPGRITFLFPSLLLLVLVWLFGTGQQHVTFWGRKVRVPLQSLVLGLSLVGYVCYNLFLSDLVPRAGFPFPYRFREISDWVHPVGFWLGVSVLVLGAIHGLRWRGAWIVGLLLALVVVAQTWVYLQHGTWIAPKRPTISLAKMDVQKTVSLGYHRPPGNRFQSDLVDRKMHHSFLDYRLAKFYRNHVAVTDRDAAYRSMAVEGDAHTIIVERYEGAAATDVPYDSRDIDEVRLLESSFNRMVFQVEARSDGFLNFTFLDTGRWRATVDGVESLVYPANGGEQAVRLDKGKHKVEFYFVSPAAIVGMIVSMVVLCLVVLFFSIRNATGKKRLVLTFSSLLIPCVLYFLWASSLYAGDNLGMEYSWDSSQLPDEKNLAYGRPTKMSSIYRTQTPFPYLASRAVDGDTKKTGFRTSRKRKNPWWQLDLGTSRRIGEIVIHDGPNRNGKRHLPLLVEMSTDGRSFRRIKEVERRQGGRSWKIPLENVEARYLRLRSRGKGVMAFNEVQVFSPGDGFESETR